ncbi:MAG: molybdopterin oxidoreductase family protein [Immundisolibacteraceae bacterium]|nr:molybdopterin oxidoreductase family protein [Immundisolibacteraceae bacterium]
MSSQPVDPVIDRSPSISDEVKFTTCYMCACRCGIKVHLKDGELRYIEGNPDHPTNKGVLCGKGSAGIMKQHSPAKLSQPLLRVGERGKGEFKEISWDEAMQIATDRLGKIRETDPKKLAFFTGRDQSQALTGWWATNFGTPNHAAHGGFCSVNMAAAGLYSIGGSFWEFGEPDWQLSKYFVMFGVAEDHDSNPIKAGLATLKANGAKFISVNPIRTGYSAIADEWVGIRPGTDGLFIFSLIHQLLKADKVDFEYLARYTNAGWLVISNPGEANDGLFARDDEGNPLCWDGNTGQPGSAVAAGSQPTFTGQYALADGTDVEPAFALMARRYLNDDYAPEAVTDTTGIEAGTIHRIASELAEVAFEQEITLDIPWTDWAGREQAQMTGRPVAFHAMRGISAHSNGFHTCRALHLLQMLLGTIDVPGGFRYKPPFPKAIPPHQLPAGKPGQVKPNSPLGGPPLGFPTGPEDLLLEEDGTPVRIDKAYSWEAPISAHGLMHMVITNAWKADPYPIDTLFLFMANMSWNSSMNSAGMMEMLTDKKENSDDYKIPFIIYSDAFFSEMVPFADLILPDTTYLERFDAISLLDRPISSPEGPSDSIRQPVIELTRNVRPFQDVLLDLGARLKLPGMTNDDGTPKYPGGYPDYIANHERKPGIGTLAGWRGANGDKHGNGEPNPNQLQAYIDNQCFWHEQMPETMHYYKHSNQKYLDYAKERGFIGSADPVILQIYSEPLQKFRLAAQGHGDQQPPEEHRERVETYFDPLPIWYPPFEEAATDDQEFPMHALTQRPMIMYHAWDSQNAWQRQIMGSNKLYINRHTAAKLGIEDDDWIWVESHHGKIKGQARLQTGVNVDTVWTWNAISNRAGTWNLDKDVAEVKKSFLLNHLISELLPEKEGGHRYSNSDPVTGQAAWYDLRVKITKAGPHEAQESYPQFDDLEPPQQLPKRPSILRYGEIFRRKRSSKTDDSGASQ